MFSKHKPNYFICSVIESLEDMYCWLSIKFVNKFDKIKWSFRYNFAKYITFK